MESTKHCFVPAIQQRIAQVVVGQEIVVERLLIALFTGGHILLEGLPGLAKTLLANTLANSIELQFKRVQFTIDLLPSDILGSEVLNPRDQTFTVQKGPIFTHLLLADEINRAAPKVQSALLEAMQERKVTIGGQGLPLPAPFLVIATQNPVEHGNHRPVGPSHRRFNAHLHRVLRILGTSRRWPRSLAHPLPRRTLPLPLPFSRL